MPELHIIPEIIGLTAFLWAALYILSEKKRLGNIIYGMRIMAAAMYGILEAVICYLFGKKNRTNY